jgi:pilus assembly protein FimV
VAAPDVKKTAPPPPVQAAESDYGPVRPGETLSRIAAKVRPQHATLEQTMLGIFRNNPAAFINNNMNLLKAGQRLRIPAADQIAALPQKDSTQALRTHTTAWASHRPVPAAGAVAPKPQSPDEQKSAAAKPAAGGKPVVKLSRGGVAGKDTPIEDRVRMLEEDLAARERALSDANERIKRLEKAASGAPAAGERSVQK